MGGLRLTVAMDSRSLYAATAANSSNMGSLMATVQTLNCQCKTIITSYPCLDGTKAGECAATNLCARAASCLVWVEAAS